MKFYQIISDHVSEDGVAYYAKLTDAKRDAKAIADDRGYEVNVERVELVPGKAGVLALANNRGWCKSSEKVFTAKPRKHEDEAKGGEHAYLL